MRHWLAGFPGWRRGGALGADSFEKNRYGLVIWILIGQLPFKCPFENGLPEAIAANLIHFDCVFDLSCYGFSALNFCNDSDLFVLWRNRNNSLSNIFEI